MSEEHAIKYYDMDIASIKKAVKDLPPISIDLQKTFDTLFAVYIAKQKIALLESLKNNTMKTTIRRENETDYGIAIIRDEIDVVKVSDIDEKIKQLEMFIGWYKQQGRHSRKRGI